MMHRCCGGSHVMGTCTCGMYHTETNSSYSMMYGHGPYDDYDHDVYSSSSSFTPSPSSVDCTLSLGTPSTRFTEDEEKRHRNHRRSSVTNFCWDLLQSKQSQTKSSSRGNSNNNNNNNNNNSNNNNNDSLLARRCANCDTTSTPLWRNGPRGPKSLCNACGIRYKKEERRASAAAAATSAAGSGGVYGHHHNNSWYAHSQNQKMSNELRFMDDSDRDSENNGIPFLSWKLNVADRTSLVHDFTR